MHNVAPSRALARRARQLLQLALVVIVVGVFIVVISIALSVIRLVPVSVTAYDTFLKILLGIGVIVVLAGLGLIIRAITWKTDNDLALIVGEFLAQHLDDQYTFIRNVSKMGLGYIDAVLVGPPGGLVFRITDREGIFANEGADWLKQNGKGEWLPASRMDLTREEVVDIKALRDYLAKHGLVDIPVFGIIVFTQSEPNTQVLVKEPKVPVSYLHSLVENLEKNYLAKARIDPQIAAEIVRMLYDH